MTTYRTFWRSARNWKEFARARKLTDLRGLSYDEARRRCEVVNAERSPRQIARGTKLEFTEDLGER